MVLYKCLWCKIIRDKKGRFARGWLVGLADDPRDYTIRFCNKKHKMAYQLKGTK